MARHLKHKPAWLVGLVIAVVIFAIALTVMMALGFGDDPVIEPGAVLVG